MHYVIVGEHTAEVCPSGNQKTRELMMKLGPQIPTIAERNGVKIVAGPYANREHTTVAIVESDRAESVDAFLVESRLPQWNSVRVIPSVPMEDAMKEIMDAPALF